MMNQYNIIILGSTGSIGSQTLGLIDDVNLPYHVYALSAHRRIDLLVKQVIRYNPPYVIVTDKQSYDLCKNNSVFSHRKLLYGLDGIGEVIQNSSANTVILNALMGFSGFLPSWITLKSGRKLLLANKESIVVGGDIFSQKIPHYRESIIPIDSEHSAIFQCLLDEEENNIDEIILTASGGPFLHYPIEKLSHITIEDALKHPIWKMGNKISIDSATLMNKGLELIEAKHLFNTSPNKLKAVIHPQSIVHGLVKFIDGSIKTQWAMPDMQISIGYALGYPNRIKNGVNKLNIEKIGSLDFMDIDFEFYPCFRLAVDCLKGGQFMSIVLNAANEISVHQFLDSQIRYIDIPIIIEKSLEYFSEYKLKNIDDIVTLDSRVRDYARRICLQ